jgi:cytochrome c556
MLITRLPRAPRLIATVSALAVLALTAMPSTASAQDRAAQQTKLRQSVFTVLGAQVTPMGAMASGRAPYDAAAFELAAQRAAFMATIAPDMFAAGSVASNSKAKPEIWRNKADFDKLMADLVDKSAALSQAAKSGSLETVRPAFAALAGTCKACHDKYKLD